MATVRGSSAYCVMSGYTKTLSDMQCNQPVRPFPQTANESQSTANDGRIHYSTWTLGGGKNVHEAKLDTHYRDMHVDVSTETFTPGLPVLARGVVVRGFILFRTRL